MKPTSLSTRLGLTVSLMGAGLVILLAALVFLSLSLALEKQTKISLNKKMEQIQHILVTDIDKEQIYLKPHALQDLVMGHDNLYLSIFDQDLTKSPLLDIGSKVININALDVELGETLAYVNWVDDAGNRILTASKRMRSQGGENVYVLLSTDRSYDEGLLRSYLSATTIAVPFLIILIGLVAWWIVQRGLSPLEQFSRVAALVSAQDLTHRISVDKLPQELGELACAINFMLHRLNSDVQQLSQFSDDLAHELRSPITNLMGKAQVTLSRERPPEEYKAVLESCTEELERVTRIVSDMLFLAQVSDPASQIQFEKISLLDEALKVVDLFSISADEKKVSLKVVGKGWVLGDRIMVQQAISNLLSNAIRHSPLASEILILIETHADTTSLSVSNPGIGIPAQHIPHLFERFYRVDPSRARQEGGTGLGLAIVRSIMSLHQGSTEVRSLPGSITVFRLIFPKCTSG
ncbi:heavy metal sensor histidine kinase [Pseudomonas sp. LS1212]|uniref:heavy metal sensor histidine kinase n=1 Tax=Pseudomonas sp. LS1212 TaxID=2972478 RepID=UPI00215C4BE5|nr:heavy metal sensor histidine kinase [Pseudomonas sp. LS1212]UVJ41948.1 heavy metal sensor histidine kinase [Pseudomonas sp. LS1212]